MVLFCSSSLKTAVSFSRKSLFSKTRHLSSTACARQIFDIPCNEFQLHKLEKGPNSTTKIEGEELMKHIETMMTVRRMETVAGDLYKSKFVRGFCHLYSGQEAVASGIHSIMNPQDTVITSYRCHGWMVLFGTDPKNVLAELLGRSDGVSRGKGGSMHMYAPNFFGGNGIVGAQVPLGAGAAFAHKYLKDGGVNFAAYGDGAANQGQNFEAYNMAKLWKLPIVFVCENNRYGMGTSQERSSASFEYYTRGDYIPGVRCDGMDFFSVREASRFCADYCREGNGPIVLETVTYRYGGHSMSDPGTSYRTRDEVKQMKSNQDCINGVQERAIELGIADKEQFTAIQKTIKKKIEQAVEFAKASPELPVKEMYSDIYVKPLVPVRGPDAFTTHHY